NTISELPGLQVKPMLYQATNERRARMTIVLVYSINVPSDVAADVSIDIGDIDIDNTHRHPGSPLATVASDFLLKRVLGGEDHKCRPSIAFTQCRDGSHPSLTRTSGDHVDRGGEFLP